MDIRRSFVERLAGAEGHGGLTVDLHHDGPLEHVYEHFAVVSVWQGGARRVRVFMEPQDALP
jgi:hypothetical protein